MSTENELKILPRQSIRREELLELLRKNGYEIQGMLQLRTQNDTYYDDPSKTLYHSDRSLRIRKTANGAVITYKEPDNSAEQETAYKQREEYEEDIPKTYIKEDGSISIEDVVTILKDKYPDIHIPANLGVAVKVANNRNKVNIKTPQGSVIEIAFDDLFGEDKTGNIYKLKDELECEIKEGNPEELTDLFNIINGTYNVQKNPLSKYKRAVKEINEQRQNISPDEIALCVMLSNILKSNEFEQLKYKGQIIHDYRVDMPENLNLNNFKNPQYLMDRISEVRRTKNYRPSRIKNLEEMFLCYFSDMDYREIEYNLVNFLNENYYRDGKPITNRMLHSQQVMLITGLISRSKEISDSERNTLLCMASALVHDIGHVPGAHETERLLGMLDGFFAHEVNGRSVIESIISRNESQILDEIKSYMREIGETPYSDDRIREIVQKNKVEIKKSIEAHSRTNSEKRGDGTVVQLPREADKIAYAISDIVDVIKKTSQTGKELPSGFFTEDWRNQTIARLGKGYERGAIIRAKIEAFERCIRTNNFGQLITSIADSVVENINDGKIYYDVEQDTWNVLNATIDYVKGLRKQEVIAERSKDLKNAATLFIIKKFNESMARSNGNLEGVWEDTLSSITNSNDIDMLQTIKTLEERFRQNPEELKKAFEKGGILDTTEIEKLDSANRQIKLLPNFKFQISDMQPYFGNQYITPLPESISDTYFNSGNGISICLREYRRDGRKDLIVKRKREKRSNTNGKRKICYYRSKKL